MILRKLGAGGVGVVYAAHAPDLGRQLAQTPTRGTGGDSDGGGAAAGA